MLDLTKPVQTRDGRKAKILCTDFRGDGTGRKPILAVIDALSGQSQQVLLYTINGVYNTDLNLDLVNIPEELVRYMATYNGSLDHRGLCVTQADCERCIQRGDLGSGSLTSKAVKVLIKVIE